MIYQLIGFIFLLSGFSHLFDFTKPWEIKIAYFLQVSFKNRRSGFSEGHPLQLLSCSY